MSVQDLQELRAAREAAGLLPDGTHPDHASTIAQQAEEPDPEGGEELFPRGVLDGDPEVTVANLIKAGQPVEVTASIRSAEVPLKKGMLSPDKGGRVTVTYIMEKAELVALHDGHGDEVTGWKVRQVLRPTYVEQVA